MLDKRDIHNYRQRYACSQRVLSEADNVSSANKKLITDFIAYLSLNNDISDGRKAKLIYTLKNTAIFLGKDFEKAERKDIEKLLLKVKSNGYTHKTISDYIKTTKQFYKWLRKTDNAPPEVSWIHDNNKISDRSLPKNVFSIEEVKALVEKADTPLLKCFIYFCYDSGGRPTETFSVRLKDLKPEMKGNKKYFMVSLKGKTGERTVPLSESYNYISNWLNYHPDKNNLEAYLFPFCFKTLERKIRKLMIDCKIERPFSLYNFRKSRASELAKSLTEAQMNVFFGWTQGSKVSSAYIRLVGRDLVPNLLALDNEKVKCLSCGHDNAPTLKFCDSCLKPLDSKMVEEERVKDISEIISDLIHNDKDMKELMERKAREFMPKALKIQQTRK